MLAAIERDVGREMAGIKRRNSSKSPVAGLLLPSIVRKGSTKIRGQERKEKVNETGNERTGKEEDEKERVEGIRAFSGNPRAACVAALLLPEG